jgi:hypothetical protein
MNTKSSLVKNIASFTPWISPIPSAYFVGISVYTHLQVPIIIAVVISIIIEFIGITSVYIYLWLMEWNLHKRKTDPSAPSAISLFFCGVYLLTTIALSVLLDIYPDNARFAIGIFPILGLIGAFNVSLISFQMRREEMAKFDRESARLNRQQNGQIFSNTEQYFPKLNAPSFQPLLDIANASRQQKRILNKQRIIEILQRKPTSGVTEISKVIGHSRTVVYTYLNELINEGKVQRSDNGFTISNSS